MIILQMAISCKNLSSHGYLWFKLLCGVTFLTKYGNSNTAQGCFINSGYVATYPACSYSARAPCCLRQLRRVGCNIGSRHEIHCLHKFSEFPLVHTIDFSRQIALQYCMLCAKSQFNFVNWETIFQTTTFCYIWMNGRWYWWGYLTS